MSFDEFNPPWLQHMLEIQRQLDNLGEPYAGFQEQLQIVDRLALNSSLEIEKSLRLQSSELLSSLDQHEEILGLSSQISESLGSHSELGRELAALSSSAYFDSVVRWQEHLHSLQADISFLGEMGIAISERVQLALATAEASSRVLSNPAGLGDLTLILTEQYQSFAVGQFKKVKKDTDSIARRRVEVVDLCGDLFEAANASLEIGAAIDEEGQKEPGQPREEQRRDEDRHPQGSQQSLFSHTAQHLGFVYRDSFEGDVELCFSGALPPRIVYLGYAIANHVVTMNSLAELATDQFLIKPTTKSMRACAAISFTVASSELDFRFIVDQLYFLLYEGAGSDTNRLTKIASDEALGPLWMIKHLRLDSRHDIDHGKRTKIRDKRAKIAKAYRSLLGKPFPVRPGEWQQAQLRLYERVEKMLARIVGALANETADS